MSTSSDLSLEGILSGKRKFDDPFLLPSSDHIPEDLESALDFCLFLSAKIKSFEKPKAGLSGLTRNIFQIEHDV